ncbi:MAG: hypothetical protein ABI923_00450 [bacterium]
MAETQRVYKLGRQTIHGITRSYTKYFGAIRDFGGSFSIKLEI